ncbi:MAG TPA: pantetheine-phosphate adenylyltransferase [Candidatus Kapabacteria bacterium]|jgi:pantetheine-phosphate adenylyltransferase|nr:pantetheine-phosphate adenylyltransferase [Candidatus Kapabacteria bacterium]HOV92547.1 pantetheine-phosphate adenylyltransferase [Candidatus Kapabacteria bacterium]
MIKNNPNIAIYPGTFDPITNGHIDVIERASQLFDKVYVVIAINPNKSTLFSEDERIDMAKQSLSYLSNVIVESYHGLTVDFAKKVNASTIIRGIRAVSDFEYEFQIALMNRKIQPDLHTIFLLPNEKYTYLNSSIIREIAGYGQDVSDFVPKIVQEKLNEKFARI